MRDGRLSGYCWHVGYPDRKKKKAADCIFLDSERFCNNEESMNYHSKCFEATHCPVRIRETTVEKAKPSGKTTKQRSAKKKPQKKEVVPFVSSKISKKESKQKTCSIPPGTIILSKKYGAGKFIAFDSETGYITIQFDNAEIQFSYFKAFQCKSLTVSESVMELVLQDMKKEK